SAGVAGVAGAIAGATATTSGAVAGPPGDASNSASPSAAHSPVAATPMRETRTSITNGLRSQRQKLGGAGSAIRRITPATSDGGGSTRRSSARPRGESPEESPARGTPGWSGSPTPD